MKDDNILAVASIILHTTVGDTTATDENVCVSL
jgi:hypothetical protein